MLNQIFLGLPLWVWLVIVFIIVFNCYQSNQQTVNMESKESFSDNKEKVKVFNIYASWCGYSIEFLKPWTDFVNSVKNNPNIDAISVKTDLGTNDKPDPRVTQYLKDNNVECSKLNQPNGNYNECLANYLQVRGFPTVIIVVGDKKIVYEGPRTMEGLTKAVNKLL